MGQWGAEGLTPKSPHSTPKRPQFRPHPPQRSPQTPFPPDFAPEVPTLSSSSAISRLLLSTALSSAVRPLFVSFWGAKKRQKPPKSPQNAPANQNAPTAPEPRPPRAPPNRKTPEESALLQAPPTATSDQSDLAIGPRPPHAPPLRTAVSDHAHPHAPTNQIAPTRVPRPHPGPNQSGAADRPCPPIRHTPFQ